MTNHGMIGSEISRRYGVSVHAYCLMTNHIHFLVTPEHEDSIPRTTKGVGSRYAQYINKQYKRTGSLWEGRHRSSLVQAEKYLLTCYRYIEFNPVAANMVKQPEEYCWSSYGSNAWGDKNWITPHAEYILLGKTQEERCHNYRELFKSHIDADDIHRIRKAAHCCRPVGDDRFKNAIERKYGIKLGQGKRGRPRKAEEVVNK